MGQDALEDVPYPISANGQQLISRVITGNTSTHPPPAEGPGPHSPSCCLPSGCFAASRAFGRGVCRAHRGLAGCKKEVLAQSCSQALLPEQMNFSYGMLRSR